jgi:hypothetical protein
LSTETIHTITIKAEGELGTVPNVAGIIRSCVKMHGENGRETGDLYFEDLHVTYSYAERVIVKKGRYKSAKKANPHGGEA